jgi:glutathione S-transferase
MKLHVFPPSPRATKVIALAQHLGLDCEICGVDLFKGEQARPEFAALNPNQRMPVLEDEGVVLWESNAILHYLASKRPASRLWPADAAGQSDVIRWLSWEGAHWTPACSILVFERVLKQASGQGEPDPAEIERGEQGFHRFASVLDGWLRSREWLVGDRLTIADFAVGAPMVMAEAARYPAQPYREMARWYGALASLPAWKSAIVPLPGRS